MLRMISTIFSTLEKLRQQQVVQSCVTAKRQLQILAPAASSHKMPAIYIYIEQWRSGRLLFERIWVAGFWRVVWTSQQWKQYYMQAYPKHFEKHAAQCFEEEKQSQKILQEVPKGKAQLNLVQQLLSVQPWVISFPGALCAWTPMIQK